MKASLTLREDPKNPIFKAKIPLSIFGVPFCSGIEAGDYEELCINFSTAFGSGPILKFSYRPNDSRRPFGLTLRTGAGRSPVTMSVEFSFIGDNRRPRFLLHFKPRSGDFSVRRSVESPLMNLSSRNSESSSIQDCAVSGENLTWDQLLSSAYGMLSNGEVRATTSVPVNRAAVKIGWSVRFPPPLSAAGDGGGGGPNAEILSKELPYLVFRKITVEHVAGDKTGKKAKKCDSREKSGDVAEARLGLNQELDLRKSEKLLERVEERMEDLKLQTVSGGRKIGI